MKLSKLNAVTTAAPTARQASASRGLAVRADVRAGRLDDYQLADLNNTKKNYVE